MRPYIHPPPTALWTRDICIECRTRAEGLLLGLSIYIRTDSPPTLVPPLSLSAGRRAGSSRLSLLSSWPSPSSRLSFYYVRLSFPFLSLLLLLQLDSPEPPCRRAESNPRAPSAFLHTIIRERERGRALHLRARASAKRRRVVFTYRLLRRARSLFIPARVCCFSLDATALLIYTLALVSRHFSSSYYSLCRALRNWVSLALTCCGRLIFCSLGCVRETSIPFCSITDTFWISRRREDE